MATASFWKALNQWFQNGNWTAISWRRLPDGHFSLEGQLHLLWDAQDAFTDTGVELQANIRSAAEGNAKTLEYGSFQYDFELGIKRHKPTSPGETSEKGSILLAK